MRYISGCLAGSRSKWAVKDYRRQLGLVYLQGACIKLRSHPSQNGLRWEPEIGKVDGNSPPNKSRIQQMTLLPDLLVGILNKGLKPLGYLLS